MSATPGVLIVDDDAPLRQTLAEMLTLHGGYRATQAGDGATALTLVEREAASAVIMDIALPDMDGRDVCRVMRRRGMHVPIILLSAEDGEADVILGLDAGANDYVVKPFRIGVLMARLRAHLRQYALSEDASFRVGPYRFKPATRELHHLQDHRVVMLSEKEVAILKQLSRAEHGLVRAEDLYGEVWDHRAPLHTHTLQTHIYRLRRKIENNPSYPRIILSAPGGYRLGG